MLVSIVILSYNRPKQIERILDGFWGINSNDFNIIIKDDVSPEISSIRNIYNKYKAKLGVELLLHENTENMGYDRNLITSFDITESNYVYLLSDDDYIVGGDFFQIIDEIKHTKKTFYISPYREGISVRRNFSAENYGRDYPIEHLIYNSILFSGLVFDRSKVLSLDLDRNFLAHCIYTQVYLSVALYLEFNDFGTFNISCLVLGGDGENFFGKNQSAVNSEVLKDRESIVANLKYQVFLRKVIFNLSSRYGEEVYSVFNKEYAKRLVGYSLKCRAIDLSTYKSFIDVLASSGINKGFFVNVTLFLVKIVPKRVCRAILEVGVNRYRKSG
ncbi:TPA: glycosyltransferase [Vibrio vulnificus]|nr:glycosyltransferase [Vibrio vulnificus]HAS8445441.1 glycosyltransferase [Vibrio vulnificus]HAS8454896.1 glycosyltransferase [Vibrio vulnificus]HDY7725107.1 glycosyltransferase [Vibrio vulnificus]